MGGLAYGAIEAGAAGFAAARVATFAVAGSGAGRLRGGPGARGSPDVPLDLFRSRTVPSPSASRSSSATTGSRS
jgi:hypothetical protein